MDAIVLLADWAEAIGGKLYIQGGGWTTYRISPESPVLNCALAVKLLIGWDEANKKHVVTFRLVDEDGAAVCTPDGEPLKMEAEIEVGRPPGARPGADLDAAFAFKLLGFPIVHGRYRFRAEIDGEPVGAGATFDVI